MKKIEEGTLYKTIEVEGARFNIYYGYDNEHTRTEEIAIDENAHDWNDGSITTPPSCSQNGIKTYTCSHNRAHTKTEKTAIDISAHYDEDENGKCDGCNEKITVAKKGCKSSIALPVSTLLLACLSFVVLFVKKRAVK